MRLRALGRPWDGCFVLLIACPLTCIMLVINGAVATAVYRWLAIAGPPWVEHPRLSQAFHFLFPVLLVCVQWWLLDRLRGRSSS